MLKRVTNINELKKEFIGFNGGSPDDIHVFFAPGRVNLIGEHTDYNNGFVMPFSLQYGTWLLVRPTVDPVVKLRSKNFPLNAQVCVRKKIKPLGETWVNYPLGIIHEFLQLGFPLGGIEMIFEGDIPNEAGLSSSASIEMVTAFAMNELFDCKLNPLELIRLGQKAENDFVGMKCGIMDQFAVTMGKKDQAVFLDCETLEHETISFELGDYVIIICNTNKKRGLSGSMYNERRVECNMAVKALNKKRKINSLSDLSWDEFQELQNLIEDPFIRKRAKHVISENNRVLLAKEYLKEGNLKKLGEIMHESHVSLRDDYEVSCFELDTMVELADQREGVPGSRMTGAGFGGCSISLVPKTQVETFMSEVGNKYNERTGIKADFYLAEPGDGVRKIV